MSDTIEAEHRSHRSARANLPPRRKALLDFIVALDESERRFPTAREICNHMGWINVTSVRDALMGLVRDGKLRRHREPDGRTYVFLLVREQPDTVAPPTAPRHSPEMVARVLADRARGFGYGTIAKRVGLTRNQVTWIIKSQKQKKPR